MATRYWVGGAGNWSSTTKWSTTSGGASGASVPISTDDVVFDANSGLVGAIATVDTAQVCASLTLTPGATVGFSTIALTASLTVTGLFSMSGTAGNQRFLISSTTVGIIIDFSVGSASGLSDLDFRDVRVIGAASPISGTRIGNLPGVTGVTFSAPKTVYWNLAGAQNWSTTGWAASSGGAPATSNFPLAQDTAVFDNTGSVTGTITMNAAIPYTGTVDMSARTSAMTLATTAFTIYGDWKNGSGTTLSGTSALTFSGRNTQTITSAGKTFTQPITVDTYGGTVQLADALNIGTTNTLTVTNGTFTTNGYAVTTGSFVSSNSNIRTINLGASTLTINSLLTLTTATNLTFNAGTSTLNMASPTGNNFNGGGLTFNNVSFTAASTITFTINGANTFANLTLVPPSTTGIGQLAFTANQTITGTLTCAGASAVRRIRIASDTRTLTVGTLSAQDCDFSNITIAGAAAGSSPTRAGDCGGNSGITFPAAKTVYWNLSGVQNWSATGWATSSGGTPAINNFPLAQDTAVFDNTGSVTGTISIDSAWNIGTFNASARTSAMTLYNGAFANVYGNWTFGTGVSHTGAAGLFFIGKGTQTITSNGVTFGCTLFLSPLTTVQLADAISTLSSNTIQVSSGTFDAVSFNVTTGGFLTSSSPTVKMGSGTWTLSGTGSVWSASGATTLYKGTANIVLSDTSTTARTFSSATSYNKLTIGGATGTSTLTISGNNQFTEIASTKTVAHTIALGTTTQTVGAWSATGTSGNVITISGTGTISVAGARVTGVDYLSLGTTTLDPNSPGEFYAGANSTGGTNFTLTAAPAATTRYWVGGGGNWDATTTTHWSASSGGAGGASVPTSADNVVFDAASYSTSYTVSLNGTQLRCKSLSVSAPATVSQVNFIGTAPLAAQGNVLFSTSAVSGNFPTVLTLSGSTTGLTLTTNGVSFTSGLTVNGVGCGWTLGSSLTGGIASAFTITNGSFDTASYNFTIGSMTANVNNSVSLSLGASTVSLLANTLPINFQNSSASILPLNFTLNAGTSTISSNATSAQFYFGGQTFYNFSLTSTAIGSQEQLYGTSIFNNLSITNRTSAGIGLITFYSNVAVNGTLTISAGTDATCRIMLLSDTLGTARTLTCAAFSGTDVDFRDITIAGAAAPISGTRLGDCKGNSGITFGAGVNKYWNLAAGGNWGGAIGWATTGGGTPAINNFPLAQDTAIFQSTGLNSSATITVNAAYNLSGIDMSARTSNTMTLATGTTAPTVYGSWTNGTGTTLSGTGALTFAGRGTQNITSATKTFTQPITINTPGGSWNLQDAFTTSNSVTYTSGTLNTSNYSLTFSGASGGITGAAGTKTLNSGSSTWTIASTGGWVFAPAATAGLSFTGTGTINLTSASAKGFTGGNFSYSGMTINQGGAGTLTISNSNTFGNITNTYSATGATTINFAATYTTLVQFTAVGTSGKLLTVSGTSAASPAVLIYSGGSTVSSDYLNISNVRAYNLSSTWYAGTNSTNSGSLGWVFTTAPAVANTGNFFFMF